MIYISYGDETSDNRIEAEYSILTNVNVNNNHLGYSGCSFVDSYGEVGDSFTMDFYIPEEGRLQSRAYLLHRGPSKSHPTVVHQWL